ncbi:unnamed protein product [Meganyctiphanes norvegica]|uniref:Dual specificity protein phosphatase 14 n=1 Tax=Meganyctiphanes norvegica TaxID=48144 RepID=A0AAV2QH16_MEGNR
MHVEENNSTKAAVYLSTMSSITKRQVVPEAAPGFPSKESTVCHNSISRKEVRTSIPPKCSSSSSSRLKSRTVGNRTTSGDASKVLPWLYLSGARALRPKCLQNLGINFIINTAALELPVLPFTDIEVMPLMLSDSPLEDIVPHFNAVADALEDVRKRNGCALVHCIAGVSRSPAFILAYLVKYLNLSLRQAYQLLRQMRPNIRPNTNFFRQLIDFEVILNGHSSVRIIYNAENGLSVPDVCEEELKVITDSRWAVAVKERKNFHNLYT